VTFTVWQGFPDDRFPAPEEGFPTTAFTVNERPPADCLNAGVTFDAKVTVKPPPGFPAVHGSISGAFSAQLAGGEVQGGTSIPADGWGLVDAVPAIELVQAYKPKQVRSNPLLASQSTGAVNPLLRK
jgi:hypothetical protein